MKYLEMFFMPHLAGMMVLMDSKGKLQVCYLGAELRASL